MTIKLPLVLRFATLLWISLLTGCFGESGPDLASPAAPADAEAPLAQAAALGVTWHTTGNSIRLSWRDTFPAGTRYQVEAQGLDGRYATVETVLGIGVPNAMTRSSLLPKGPSAFRVIALREGRSLPLITPSGEAQWNDTLSGNTPAIVLDGPEPLTSSTRLSFSTNLAYAALEWRINTLSVGPGASAPGTRIHGTSRPKPTAPTRSGPGRC